MRKEHVFLIDRQQVREAMQTIAQAFGRIDTDECLSSRFLDPRDTSALEQSLYLLLFRELIHCHYKTPIRSAANRCEMLFVISSRAKATAITMNQHSIQKAYLKK